MTVDFIGLAALTILVLVFVLEPVLRARGDRVMLDAVALPRPADEHEDDLADDVSQTDRHVAAGDHAAGAGGRVTLERPAGSDAT